MNISEAVVSIIERGGQGGSREATYLTVFEEMTSDIFLFSDCLFITLNRENQLHCFSMYLAFSQLDNSEQDVVLPSPGSPLSPADDADAPPPPPIRIVSIISGRRIEAVIRINNHDQRKQWFNLIRDNVDQSKRHAASKIAAEAAQDGSSGG
jgi:hypothetical protein